MKILVVDDHAVVRHGVKQILCEHFHHAVIGEAQDAEHMFSAVEKGRWDMVVLDVGMPGKGGLEALKDLKRLQPKLPVLVLSAYPEDQLAVRLIRAGAAGYLSRTAPRVSSFTPSGRYWTADGSSAPPWPTYWPRI